MKNRVLLLLSFLFFGLSYSSNGQIACPDNIDFELGNLSVWNYYIGSCCTGGGTGTMTGWTSSTPIATRHRLTSGTATDPYGGFPVVAPGGGSYSFRLGNSNVNYEADRARYYVHVPAGATNYSLVYRFAIVLQDGGHSASIQPRFNVTATDSASGVPVHGSCAAYYYTAGSTMPGFTTSSSSSDVHYLPWTTATINLSGTGGRTITIDFESGDCGAGGHFGYGYLDMNCSLFALSTLSCDSNNNTLTAPSGYASYLWYDSSTFASVLATTQTVTFTTTTPTTYALVLLPYAGYGCPDTLYTRITPSNLQVRGMRDTTLCFSSGLVMDIGATDIIGPLTYSWSPSSSLSCDTCAHPIATPSGTTTYYVTVTNPAGCTKTDTIVVSGDFIPVTITNTPASCYGTHDGTATITSPVSLSYVWSSAPPQYTATATGLAAGTYTCVITDSVGCTGYLITTIAQPPANILFLADSTDPTTCGGSDGTITIGGLVPGSTDTIDYIANGVHVVAYITASSTGTYVFSGLVQGIYDSFTVVTSGCPYTITRSVSLNDPLPPARPYAGSNSPVCLGDSLIMNVIETTTGCTFRWSGPGGYVSTTQNPLRNPSAYSDTGRYIVVVSKANCFVSDTTYVSIKPKPIPFANNNSPFCAGNTLNLTSFSSNGATSYSWSGPAFYSSTNQNPSIANAQTGVTGTYTVTMFLNGCKDMATTNVVVNPIPAAPIVADLEYCQYDVVPALTATGTNLTWYTDAITGSGTGTAPVPSTALPGTFTWYVSQTTAAGCMGDRAAINVKINPFPQVSMTQTDSVFCVGNSVTFFGGNSGEATTGITWHFGDDSVLNVNPVMHTFDFTGTYTITIQSYYKLCPTQTISKTVTVYPTPKIYLGDDTVLCGGSGVILLKDYINASNPAARWQWNNGDSRSGITITQPGLYFAKVIIDGCEATDSILVVKDCYVNIPNVFTPNGDGINDYFFPRDFLAKGLTSFKLDVYNRWGQLIFTTDKTEGKGWDGMLNGIPQPEGVFVYVLDATFRDGKMEHHQGNVTLIR